MSRAFDAWDEPAAAIASTSASTAGMKSKPSKIDVIRDDWDDDDDEDEDGGRSADTQNKKLWEEANSKASRPMPSVIMSRGPMTTTPSSLPLNQPPAMRILKRPSPSASPSQSSSFNTSTETLQDREARYQAARERIFGPSSGDGTSGDAQKTSSNSSVKKFASPASPSFPATKVIREPLGPSSYGAGGPAENKGFRERKAKAPPSTASRPVASSMVISSPDMPA